jgi:hypothetical protein
MAVGRISGQVLKSELSRDGVDVFFNNENGDPALLYLSVDDSRVGINNSSPNADFDITGELRSTTAIFQTSLQVADIFMDTTTISTTSGNLVLTPATSTDEIQLNSDVTTSANLTVDNNITSTNGTITAPNIDIGQVSITEDGAGNTTITASAGGIVVTAGSGESIDLNNDVNIDGDLSVTGSTQIDINLNVDGIVSTPQVDTGRVEIDENMLLNQNTIQILSNDTDLRLQAGPIGTDPFGNPNEDTQIRLLSKTTIIKGLNILGTDAFINIDDKLLIDDNTISSVTNDIDISAGAGDSTSVANLNLTSAIDTNITATDGDINISTQGDDSTVHSINFLGTTITSEPAVFRDSIKAEVEVDVPDLRVERIGNRPNDGDIQITSRDRLGVETTFIDLVGRTELIGDFTQADGFDMFLDRLDVNNIRIDDNSITTTSGNLFINPTDGSIVDIGKDVNIATQVTVPDVISTNSIQGVLMDIDNIQIDGNEIKSTSGHINVYTPTPATDFVNIFTNLEVDGNIHATGSITADGDLVLGDQNTDNITFNADVNSDVLPNINAISSSPDSTAVIGFDLGSETKYWDTMYLRHFDLNGYEVRDVNNDHSTYSASAAKDVNLITEGGMIRYFEENLATNRGDNIPMGFPEDSVYNDGAFFLSANTEQNGVPKEDIIDDKTFIAEAIDLLNESMNNIRNNTFIRDIDAATPAPAAAGSGQTFTLNLNVDGEYNRVEVDWDVNNRFEYIKSLIEGAGGTYNVPSGAHDSVYVGTNPSTVSFVYDAPLGGLFTVKVTVRNTNAQVPGSAGTDSDLLQENLILVYTQDPVMGYNLYRSTSGGSILSGNNLYVIEGNSLALENITTNTGPDYGLDNTVTYTVNWGDGITETITPDDTEDGGSGGPRLAHTWLDGTQTGTGNSTVTLTMTDHQSCDPNILPLSTSKTLKVYENDPVDPDGLSTKTISFSGGTGNANLCANFTNNDVNLATSSVAGTSLPRTVSTSGTIKTTTFTNYSYAETGQESDYYDGLIPAPVLTAEVNGVTAGTRTFSNSASTNSGSNFALKIDAQSDYNLLNANGGSTSFSNSIFYPNAFFGYRAHVEETASAVPFGLCTYQLRHDVNGDTNLVEFVKDDVNSVPVITAGTVIENNAGTYRYISGIPYYNSGNPTLTLTGITVQNWIGQAYLNSSQIVQANSDTSTSPESQTGQAITQTYYNYSTIEGTVSLLDGSGNPFADSGKTTGYVLDDLTLPIVTSSRRTIDSVRYRIRNLNGYSSYRQETSIPIALHTSGQYGISEIAIDVASGLGNGVYTDDAIRIHDFDTDPVDNPVYTSSTNFYTNDVYTEGTDSGISAAGGIANIREAIIRLGEIEHNVEDYTNYLPLGPDLNTATRANTQYFTMAFRRRVVANFAINITAPSGVAGVWIAAPGTAIDNGSSLNGWLDCSTQYAGAGVPGAIDGNAGGTGNGSDGCAITGADRIIPNQSLSGGYDMTLGSENMSNAQDNVVLVRIALSSGQSVTSLNIGQT